MRLLIVGASGFLGRNLITALPHTWNIFATYNRDITFPAFVKDHGLTNVQGIHCDLLSKDVQKQIRSVSDIDSCIYLAANTDVPSLVADSRIDVNENIAALVNFLEAFRGPRLIFVSSGAVYMGLQGAVNPDVKLSPTIPYSISKLTSEHYVKFYALGRKAFDQYAIVRFFGSYGYYEASRKLTRRVLESALSGERFAITIVGDGENLIDVMWVEDTVRGIKALIEAPELNFTADFCAGNACTINQYVMKLAQILSKDVVLKHEGVSHEYIKFYASPKRLNDFVGFRPETSLREGVMLYTRWLNYPTTQNA